MSNDTLINDYLYSSFMEDDVIKIGEIDSSKDTYPHNYVKTTYDHARKERLDDIVFDYISNEDTSPEQFYSELKSSVQDCVDYFEKFRDRSQSILDLITNNDVVKF
jgi:hypothetical protein